MLMRAATTLIFIATAYTILSFFLLLQIFKNFGRDIHALGSLSLAPQNGVSDERVWYRQAAYAPSTSPSYAPSTSPSYAPSTSPSRARTRSASASHSGAPSAASPAAAA